MYFLQTRFFFNKTFLCMNIFLHLLCVQIKILVINDIKNLTFIVYQKPEDVYSVTTNCVLYLRWHIVTMVTLIYHRDIYCYFNDRESKFNSLIISVVLVCWHFYVFYLPSRGRNYLITKFDVVSSHNKNFMCALILN